MPKMLSLFVAESVSKDLDEAGRVCSPCVPFVERLGE